MSTGTTETRYLGIITRRIDELSFETHDPALRAEWLRALDYVDVPRRGPREHARLQLGTGTAIVFASGLVVTLQGVN